MSAPIQNIGAMRAVASRLDGLGLDYAFVGGAIVGLLLDESDRPARATEDVDVIIEMVAGAPYSDTEKKLRKLHFEHDMTQGAPLCRWKLGFTTVDIMPVDGAFMGLDTRYLKEALETAAPCDVDGKPLRLISPVAFLVTKYMAFTGRSRNDYYGSHDLEDFITVIDGRAHIVEETDHAPEPLRSLVIKAVRTLQGTPDFAWALSGHLPSDDAGQRRLPLLLKKLKAIEMLPVNDAVLPPEERPPSRQSKEGKPPAK